MISPFSQNGDFGGHLKNLKYNPQVISQMKAHDIRITVVQIGGPSKLNVVRI